MGYRFNVNCIYSSDNTNRGTCAVKRNWLGLYKECEYHPIYNNCSIKVEHPPKRLKENCDKVDKEVLFKKANEIWKEIYETRYN